MSLDSEFTTPLRLGMIGGGRNGYIGSIHRLSAQLDSRWELVSGAFSRDIEVSQKTALDWNLDQTRAYSSYEDFITHEASRSDRPDAVAICTTNDSHFEIASALLDAGFHVFCEKPLTTSHQDAWTLADKAAEKGLLVAVGNCYSGYPMVREAKHMIEAGKIGEIRSVVMEYASQYGADEEYSMPWLDDPARSGPSGVVAGTGTHAFHLIEFITGREVIEISADLAALVEGHQLEDHAAMLLRFDNGARGTLWNTSLAIGCENGIFIRIFGSKGSISWRQEAPNSIVFAPKEQPVQTITRNGFGAGSGCKNWTRTPYGHPEGYIEAFANLYAEFGEAVEAFKKDNGKRSVDYLYPDVEDGARGIDFVYTAIASSNNNGQFTKISDIRKEVKS